MSASVKRRSLARLSAPHGAQPAEALSVIASGRGRAATGAAQAATGLGRPGRQAWRLVAVAVAAFLAACSAPPQPSVAPGGASSPLASAAGGAAATTAAQLPTPTAPPIDLSAVPSRVHVAASAGASAWIGPAGGSLSATGTDGTSFTLTIPQDAVDRPTPIAMTPVDSIDHLGLSGGLAGAVYLEPRGLKLAEPAMLTIASSKSAPTGMRLVGIDVADDGTTTDLIPAAASGGSITDLISHFSAPGAGFGTSQDLQLLVPPPGGGQLQSVVTTLLAEDVPWSPTTLAVAKSGILTAWSQVVEPELNGPQDDVALLGALADWRQLIFLMNLYTHLGDARAAIADGSLRLAQPTPSFEGVILAAGQGDAGRAIAGAMGGNRTLCKQSHDLHALANVIFWTDLGPQYDPFGDWATVSSTCATIEASLFNPPSNLAPGKADSFQIAFDLKFTDGTSVPADFNLTLDGSGFIFQGSGSSHLTAGDPASQPLTIGVRDSQGPPYTLQVQPCWSLDGIARNLCGPTFTQTFGTQASPSPHASSAVAPPPGGTPIPGGFRVESTAPGLTCSAMVLRAVYGNDIIIVGNITWRMVSGPKLRFPLPTMGNDIIIDTGPTPGTIVVTATFQGETESLSLPVKKSQVPTC